MSKRGTIRTRGLIAAALCLAATALMFPFLHAGSVGAAAPRSTWYFAEGSTRTGFQEYLCIANTSSSQATVKADFLFGTGPPKSAEYSVKPRSRYTIDVNSVVGRGLDVSAYVYSDTPGIYVERPVYFDYQGRIPEAHTVVGASSPSGTWYFAEGYTGSGFEEYVCVLNPGAAQAHLGMRFQTSTGPEIFRAGVVPPRSRATWKVNDLIGPGMESSLALTSDQPVVAERPMYFDYRSAAGAVYRGGHCVMGANSLSTRLYFAEGTTRGGFDEWLTIQNPGSKPLTVTADYQAAAGQGANTRHEYLLGARQRRTLFVPREAGAGKDVSVMLFSDSGFLAERPMYYSFNHSGLYFEGASCALGQSGAGSDKFFAEGFTGPPFEQWICLQNPSDADCVLEIDYLTQDREPLAPRTVRIAPRSRATIFVNTSAGPGLELSTSIKVLRGSGFYAERSMYLDRTRWSLPSPAQDLYGMCFSPYVSANPLSGGTVSQAEVTSLLEKIAPYSSWIRTFGTRGEWAFTADAARSMRMHVAASADISSDTARNTDEISALVDLGTQGRIDMAVVGDEVLMGNVLSEDQMIAYVRSAKAAGVPVGTSDSWDQWLEHPRLAAECDVLIMNVYPYWEGTSVDKALESLRARYEQVKAVAGGRQVIIETGWPTGGQVIGSALPGPTQSAQFFAEFVSWANSSGVPYFYFEAFDEPWKASREGGCGSCWGLWEEDGTLKPEIATGISARP